MHRIRLLTVMAATALLVLVSATAAQADDPWGDVNCNLHPENPQCTVVVVDPGGGGGSNGGVAADR